MDPIQFLASPAGRILRIVAGIAIILIGYLWVPAPWKYVLEGVGLIPILTGLLDLVLVGPLMGKPISGKEIRSVSPDQRI